VLNSLPFDWLLRRRVEVHVTFSLINSLFVPDAGQGAYRRVALLAATLSCVDRRYSDYARRAGVETGPVVDATRAEIEAEIDALVARAYGLTSANLRVIFGDFNEAALPAAQRDRTLELFEEQA